jgi:uncharacterized membrane protein YbaN (DUF454 family)
MTPSRNLKKLALTIGGWTFVVLGVAGLFLPVLQGILFLAVGLIFLSIVSPRARLLRQRLVTRYPSLGEHLARAQAWLNRKKIRNA